MNSGPRALDGALRTLHAPAETRAAQRQRREAAGTVLVLAGLSPARVADRAGDLAAVLRTLRDEATTTARESDEERAALVVDTRRDLARAIATVAGVEPSLPVAEAVATMLSGEDPEVVAIGTTAAKRYVTGLAEQEVRPAGVAAVADALAAVIERVADGDLPIGSTDLNWAGTVLRAVVRERPDLSEPLVAPMVRATFEATSKSLTPAPLSVLRTIATVHPAAVAAHPESVEELLERFDQLDPDFEDWSSLPGSPGSIANILRVVRAAPMAATGHVDVLLRAIASLDGVKVHEPALEALRAIAREEPGAVLSAAADIPGSLFALTLAVDRLETTTVREYVEDRARLLPVPRVTRDGAPEDATLAGLETLTRLVRHDPGAFSGDVMLSTVSLGWNVLITHSDVRIVTEALRLLIWCARDDPGVLDTGLERALAAVGPDPGDWVENGQQYGPAVARLALTLYEDLADAGVLDSRHSRAVTVARERAADFDPTDGDLVDEVSDGPTRLVDVIDPETDTALGEVATGENGPTVDEVVSEGETPHPPALTDRIDLLGADLVRHAVWVPQPRVRPLAAASHGGQTASARWQLQAFATAARQDSSAVGPNLGRVLAAAGRLDDPEVVAAALAVALEVANDDPGAVAPHVGTIADLADGHGDDVTVAAAGVIAEVGRHDPAAATAGVETLLAAVEPLADGVEDLLAGYHPEEENPHPGYAAALLEVVEDIAVEHPGTVGEHVESAVDAGTALFPVVFGPTRSLFAEFSPAEEQAEEAFRRALLATMSTVRSVGIDDPAAADRGLARLFGVDEDFEDAFDRITSYDSGGRWAAEYSLLLSELTALTRRPDLARQCLAELAPVVENWCVRFGDEETDISAAVAHVEAACVAVLDRFDDSEVVLAALDRLEELSASFPDRFPGEAVLDVFTGHSDLAVRRRAVELLYMFNLDTGDDDTVERFGAAVADATDPVVLSRGMLTLVLAAGSDSLAAVEAAGPVGAAIAESEHPRATMEAGLPTRDALSRTELAFIVALLRGYCSATEAPLRSAAPLVDETLATALEGGESAPTTATAADLLGRTGSVLADGTPEPPAEFVERYSG